MMGKDARRNAEQRARRTWGNVPAVASREVLGPMDEPLARYRKVLEADKLSDLVEELARWPILARDAHEAAAKMTAEDFHDFQHGVRKERRGRYAGDEFAEKYGAILLPAAMVEVVLVADRFKVPFGLAYLRLWEAGHVPEPVQVEQTA